MKDQKNTLIAEAERKLQEDAYDLLWWFMNSHDTVTKMKQAVMFCYVVTSTSEFDLTKEQNLAFIDFLNLTEALENYLEKIKEFQEIKDKLES